MAKFNKWVNNPYKRKTGPLTLQQEYDMYRHEVMRMNTIAKKRIQRSKEQGFTNILLETDRRKPMTTNEFSKLSKEEKEVQLKLIKDRTVSMWNYMDLPTSSIGGYKDMIKEAYKNKGIGNIKFDFVSGMSESDAFKVIQSRIEKDIEGLTSHYKTQQLFDEIDADTTLTAEEKKDIKTYIRSLLKGEYFDYDQAYFYTIDEIKKMLPDIKLKMLEYRSMADTSGEIDWDAINEII